MPEHKKTPEGFEVKMCCIWAPCKQHVDACTQEMLVQVTLGTNYFGPMLLTHLLMDRLRESAPSRIVWVVSSLEVVGDISWEDLK